MAMVGRLYALPKTQLTKRLQLEGRLFENPSILTDDVIDQTTSGPNFVTTRPRVDVLSDHVNVLQHIYAPAQYYRRVLTTCLSLRPAGKHKPSFAKRLKMVRTLLKLCATIGLDKTTGWLYWKTLVTVGLRNPGAIEAAVNLAAMFIHFQAHARFIIDLTNKEIESLKSTENEKINHGIRRGGRKLAARKESISMGVNR